MSGQNLAIEGHVIAAGGGNSSNAIYDVTGTIGQAATGHSEGNRYGIDSGFWGFVAAIQMPGSPVLTIRQSSSGTLTISWAAPAIGFVLQSAANLAAADWTTIGTTPADDGTMRSLVLPLASGNHFFRLIKIQPASTP